MGHNKIKYIPILQHNIFIFIYSKITVWHLAAFVGYCIPYYVANLFKKTFPNFAATVSINWIKKKKFYKMNWPSTSGTGNIAVGTHSFLNNELSPWKGPV